MTGTCPKCGANVSMSHNFCTGCGEPLTLPQPYSGKTAPIAVATRRVSQPGGPAYPAPAAPYAAARTAPPHTGGLVTTGVAGREAQVSVNDVSGSMDEPGQRGSKIDDLKAAQRTHVLQKMHFDRQDLLSMASFSSDAMIDCEWAVLRDPSTFLRAIDALTPGGGTCFQAGLERAEELFRRCPCPPGPGVLHKIIFFTDGHNNEGDPLPASKRLRDMGAIIQAVGFGESESDVDVAMLRRIVSVLDGREQYWFCRDAQELTQTFKALSSKTRVLPR